MATIYIGHASIDEHGNSQGGTAGDQTSKEVCKRTWYSKPWDFMAIHPNANVREKHAAAIEAACDNNKIGYNQGKRNTLYTQAKAVSFVLKNIKTACDCDCSSLQNVAAIVSGSVSSSSYGSNGWTTISMLENLINAGYIIIAKSTSISGYSNLSATQKKSVVTGSTYLTSSEYCVRGAIYVKSGSHTVAGLTNGSNYQKTLSKAGISTTTTQTTSSNTSSSTSTSSKLKVSSTVKAVQTWLNKYYSTGLSVDGKYGSKTKSALIKAWQKEVGGLTVDGNFGSKSQVKASSAVIKSGSSGIIVTIWQAYLVCRGYDPNGIDGIFGSGCKAATIKFQKANGLTQDGEVGKNTWTKAFA